MRFGCGARPGGPIAQAKTVAFGCIIRRPAAQVASAQITYARMMWPRSCSGSARRATEPGQIGPMALNLLRPGGGLARRHQALHHRAGRCRRGRLIAGAGDFQDARALVQRMRSRRWRKWADAGAPEGDPKDLCLRRAHFHDDWALGKPDMVLQPSRAYHVDADGGDVYRCYVIPTDFTQDRYVSAVDVQPGNRAVVHHVIAFIDGDGKSANLDGHEKEPGYTSPSVASGSLPQARWAAGHRASPPTTCPPGVATWVPKGARIVLQVHYHKDGKPETDLSRVGIYFAKGSVDKTLHVIPVVHSLQIPANDSAVYGQRRLPRRRRSITIWLPSRRTCTCWGRKMALTAIKPDGTKVPAGLGLGLGLQLAVYLFLQEAAGAAGGNVRRDDGDLR